MIGPDSPSPVWQRHAGDVCVLPAGAIEQHAEHLPLNTDLIVAEAFSKMVAEGLGAALLPAMAVGTSYEHTGFRGTLSLRPETAMAVVRDLADEVERQAFRVLVIVNGHGGNDFRQMIRELQPRTRVFLAALNWYKVVDPKPYFTDLGDHAGEQETSVMMHLAPELVLPLEDAGDGRERRPRIAALREGWAWAPRRWTQISADTGVGNPHAATKDKGARFADAAVRRIASFLVELAAADVDELYE